MSVNPYEAFCDAGSSVVSPSTPLLALLEASHACLRLLSVADHVSEAENLNEYTRTYKGSGHGGVYCDAFGERIVVKTVAEACLLTTRDWLRNKNFGKRTLRELIEVLADAGHYLSEYSEESLTKLLEGYAPETEMWTTTLSTHAVMWAEGVGLSTISELREHVADKGLPSDLAVKTRGEIEAKLARYARLRALGVERAKKREEADLHRMPERALVGRLMKRWSLEEAAVLADWCEERGLWGAATSLRSGSPPLGRSVLKPLLLCLGNG